MEEDCIVKVLPGYTVNAGPMITVALAKGALLKDSVARFAAAGLIFRLCWTRTTVS